jgi:hypothetical protein
MSNTAALAAKNRRARERAGLEPGSARAPLPQPVPERTGLEWLLHKKRITPRQFWAGTVYGNLYRAAAINGMEPLRSCLNIEPTGGDKPWASTAEHDLTVEQKLTACHVVALSSEASLVATCAAVCGRQLTPRQITPDQRGALEIEVTLQLALNLLAAHFEGRAGA